MEQAHDLAYLFCIYVCIIYKLAHFKKGYMNDEQVLQPVWPDVGMKSSPIFPKFA